jgi:hypothetical protein
VNRGLAVGVAAVVALGVGLGAGALVFPRSVTHTSTVYATTTTGLPAGCVRAIALTRRLLLSTSRKEAEAIARQFQSAAAACEIPPECESALTFFQRIADVHSRIEMLDLARGFDSAVASCRAR